MSGGRDLVHPPLLQGLKAATKAAVRAFGGQDAAALHIGRGQSQVCNYGLPNTPDFIAVDAVLALEGATHGTPGHPHVTRYLAREAGFALAPLPSAGVPGKDWGEHSAALIKEMGDVLAGLGEALKGDHDVRAAEARALRPEASDLVRAAVELEAALKARAGEA